MRTRSRSGAARRRGKRRALLVAALAAVAACSICADAGAAVYWGNGAVIGRVNNDGTYLQDGGGPGRVYIGANGVNPIRGGVCSVAVDGSHIYWGDRELGTIGRANLDGTDPNFALVAGASEPCGLAVDANYVYWANQGSASIGRARLDGSEVNQEFVEVPKLSESSFVEPRPCGIAVNGTHVFWGNYSEDLVGRAKLDGGEVIPDLIEPSGGPCGIAVTGAHIFWGSYSSEIGRADLDGSDPEPKFITGLDQPCGVAVDGSGLYWITAGTRREIGRANLDGGSITRVASETIGSCALAVDSLFVSPPPPTVLAPPPPPPSLCKLEESRHLPRQGKLLIAVLGPSAARIEVLTRGLRSRVLTTRAPTAHRAPRRWWVAVSAAGDGRAAQRIRQRLRRSGRASVGLRVRCRGARGELPVTVGRRVTLVAKQARGNPGAS